LSRNRFGLLLVTLLVGVFVSSCGAGDGGPEAAQPTDLAAKDFCPEVRALFEDFNFSISNAYVNGDQDLLEKLVGNAEDIFFLAEKAESQGLDLSSAGTAWMKNLKLSAQVFVTLAESDPDRFSDDELHTYVEQIVGHYAEAAEQCQDFNA